MGVILNDDIGKRCGKVWFDFENRARKKFEGKYFIAIQEPLEYKNWGRNSASCEAVERKILASDTIEGLKVELAQLIVDLEQIGELI